MLLNELADNKGARKARTRLGRGIGSGKGKTCARGHKGQKSRSGVAIKGFEGGQMPIYRRLPKRGFTNLTRKDFAEVTTGRLQAALDKKLLDGSKAITEAMLIEAGVTRKSADGVKLLQKGELKAKVTLEIAKATKGALALVEKAGGKVTLVEKAAVKSAEKKATPKKDAKAAE